MSDARIRELERRYLATGAAGDLISLNLALRRSGLPIIRPPGFSITNWLEGILDLLDNVVNVSPAGSRRSQVCGDIYVLREYEGSFREMHVVVQVPKKPKSKELQFAMYSWDARDEYRHRRASDCLVRVFFYKDRVSIKIGKGNRRILSDLFDPSEALEILYSFYRSCLLEHAKKLADNADEPTEKLYHYSDHLRKLGLSDEQILSDPTVISLLETDDFKGAVRDYADMVAQELVQIAPEYSADQIKKFWKFHEEIEFDPSGYYKHPQLERWLDEVAHLLGLNLRIHKRKLKSSIGWYITASFFVDKKKYAKTMCQVLINMLVTTFPHPKCKTSNTDYGYRVSITARTDLNFIRELVYHEWINL